MMIRNPPWQGTVVQGDGQSTTRALLESDQVMGA
jgi:hypothetical protein